MKLSWGTGIVAAFIAFICFILYFVVIASTEERANHDLVTDHYYEQELGFQQEIDAEKRAASLEGRIRVEKVPGGLWLAFPETWDLQAIQGSVFLYRPSNKALDFELPISLQGSGMLVPEARLPEGRWNLSIGWEAEGINYLQKEALTYVKLP